MFDTIDESNSGRDAATGQLNGKPQAVRRELFLDLEDTLVTPIVNGWGNFEIINLDKIKRVLTAFEPHTVNVFSFAIWDQHQRNLFNTHCRPHLEKMLGMQFNLVLTVDDDITPICCKEMGMSIQSVDFQEMSSFWGKQGAFRLCMRHHAVNHRRNSPSLPLHVLLLDDVVFNERLVWPDIQTTVEQRNIDQL